MCLIGGVNWCLYWHNYWSLCLSSVSQESVESQSRVSRYIGWVAFYYRSTGRPTVSHESIGSALAMYHWAICQVLVSVVYQSTIILTMPVKLFFFPTSSPRLFLLLQGTCQLTHMDTFLLITHIGCGWYQIDQTLNCRLFSSIGWHLHYLSVDIHVSVAILGESRSRVGWLTRQMRVDRGFGHYVD